MFDAFDHCPREQHATNDKQMLLIVKLNRIRMCSWIRNFVREFDQAHKLDALNHVIQTLKSMFRLAKDHC